MLQVHPDSTCDVCLDQYVLSNPAKTPHAIGCGHIFCLECLAHLNHPTSCPLCRKAFGMDRVKKLHVDRHVPGEREAAMPDAWNLVRRLARCARSDVDTRTTEELIGEVQRWLEADDHKELFPEVDAVFSALIKFKSLQERFHDQDATISSLTARLRRDEAARDEGRKDALVEQNLTQKVSRNYACTSPRMLYISTTSQIRELEAQLDFYRQHFPGVRDLARENLPPVNGPTSEDRGNGGRNVSNSQGNPLPYPPRPVWYPFTARNPNFVPPGNSQSEPSQPYAHQTGVGAVYYEGANFEDRVVPPAVRDMGSRDVPPEQERTRSRSGHRDHSAERRSRRRDGESDKHRRRRDRHRRDTLDRDDVAEPPVLSGEPPLMGNALGIHPPSLHPGRGLYSSVAPPVTSIPGPADRSNSRDGGAPSSHPPTSQGTAPPIAATTSGPGSSYREAPQRNGSYSRREEPITRPSSTPNGPVLSSWVAPDLSNPSLNSLGLSAPGQDVGRAHSQPVREPPAAMPLSTRDSVSSWGTAESAPPQGDLFSTLRPLGSAPADSSYGPTDLFPRPYGQLLGVGRPGPIATPQPQRPQISVQSDYRSSSNLQAEDRPYSRYAYHPRSQSQASLIPNRDTQPTSAPPLFTPNDRGFPYASVPPPPVFPNPSGRPQSATPASATSSYNTSTPGFPPIPYISPPPVNAASRPPNSSQPYYSGSSTSQPQNSNYRPHY